MNNHEGLKARIAAIPVFSALDIEVRSIASGSATLFMPFRKNMAGIFRSFHGGLLMTLADTAACVAVLSVTFSDATVTTTDMNIRFLNSCLTDATATARVLKVGKTLCPVEVELRDKTASLVAVAQVTYMRLPRLPLRQFQPDLKQQFVQQTFSLRP